MDAMVIGWMVSAPHAPAMRAPAIRPRTRTVLAEFGYAIAMGAMPLGVVLAKLVRCLLLLRSTLWADTSPNVGLDRELSFWRVFNENS